MLKVRSSIHNHCTFCDGKNTAEEMILSAIKAGFTDFGMSSHSPIECCKNGWSMRDEEGYKKELFALKEKYKNEIRVYCGIEVDYYTLPRENAGYDYLIDSVHKLYVGGKYYAVDSNIDYFRDTLKEAFGGDGYKMAKEYYDHVKRLIDEKNPKLLCHVDLVTKFNDGYVFFDESDKRYLSEVYSALDFALEKDCVIEVNYGAIARKCKTTPYPAAYLLGFLKEKGARLLIGGDCHSAEFIDFGFREGVELLKAHGIDRVTVFEKGEYVEKGI